MSQRQQILLEYLREVAKDLLLRGIIRRQRGQDILEILRQEPSVLAGTLMRDLSEAGFSLKNEIVDGFVGAAKDVLGSFVESFYSGSRR